MRLFILVLVAGIATGASAQNTDLQTYTFDRVGVAVTLPSGFAVEQVLEDHLPDVGVVLLVDEDAGRTLSVEIHTYFEPEQASAYGHGERAQTELAHLPGVEAASPASYPVPAGSAFRFGDDTYRGVALYGCDEIRCYHVSATATGDDEGVLAEMLEGVHFEG